MFVLFISLSEDGVPENHSFKKQKPLDQEAREKCRKQSPYQSFPSEDVAIETDPVFGEVEPALKENVFLQGAGVICQQRGRVITDNLHCTELNSSLHTHPEDLTSLTWYNALEYCIQISGAK